MSWQPAEDPKPGDRFSCNAIETLIIPRSRDIGSFEVRRALPSTRRQMVGPFIFFDQMGPSEFLLGTGMDVRPHPHIGLSTVTYLFEGEIMHRDSLGTVVPIRPGELNWMTAGCGIAHSERTPPALRTAGSKLFGIQCWVALARQDEEKTPEFTHYAAGTLPVLEGEGKTGRIIAGSLFGKCSPVRVSSPMFYADMTLAAGASVPIDNTMNGRSTQWRARSKSPATLFRLERCSYFVRVIASPSERNPELASSCWGANRWMVRATFGGISSRRARNASTRPRRIGSRGASILSRAITSSSRCPNLSRRSWVRRS
jgi:redox-sensitive bicupin YhaK (pirin superfamily)